MRMTAVWILILSLCKTSLVQVVELYQPSLVSVKNGEAASLNCTFPQDSRLDFVIWYKQRPGELPQEIGTILKSQDAEISPEFLSSGLNLKRIPNGLSLTVPRIKADDEGMHFCGESNWNKISFSNRTFLAVTGHGELNISVVQSPDVERVPPGESVSLQCSVLSEKRTAELQVFWFRSSAGDSHPEIISTHHNGSHQCEISSSPHSCVYNLSKSVLSVSDTGTYYCAVFTCGKILLGNGTTVGLTLSQVVGLYQPSLVSVKNGEAASLNCTFPQDSRLEFVVWYKQRPGELPQEIGTIIGSQDAEISPEFLSSGLNLKRIPNGLSLTIPLIKADDEGMHFCGMSVWNKKSFSNGTFLAVTGHGEFSISVVQSPEVERVPPGESVSLQCSVLSERRTAELQVFWFRSSAGDSYPEIISTHHNSSRQCEISSSPHSCVYNLSKSVLSVSDTGTYYCAVLTCGKILLGNGTTVSLKTPVDAVLMIVGAALGVCVLVISAQAVLICRRRNCEHCSVRLQQETLIKTSTTEERDALELDYAGIQFNERKTRRGQEKRGETEHSVYSEVLYSAVSNQ
ncbi:uncharacterized protein LOC143526581 [Brachyhypopomus gauderio]|uniref:uncharacterized protein LOC143526581 n=1 Tax=Brachyhypopomus gauderio TaxID=698409 RepID=UPI004042E17C